MNRRWVLLGGGLGLVIGLVVGPTLFANEANDKQPADRPSEVVAAAQSGTATTDTKFVEIEPVRAFDSRAAAYVASGAFAPNTSRVIVIKDGHNSSGGVTLTDAVPLGATAVSYNVTIASPTGPNFLAITPGNATGFTASAVNFNGTADVANAGIVSIDANRTVKIWNGNQAGTTHAIIDITGYFVKPLLAEVNADGTLKSGSRVVSASRVGANTGWYDVTFDRAVSDCAYTVTIGDDSTESAGVVDVASAGSIVRVFTQDTSAAAADRAFYLVVTC